LAQKGRRSRTKPSSYGASVTNDRRATPRAFREKIMGEKDWEFSYEVVADHLLTAFAKAHKEEDIIKTGRKRRIHVRK